jgi:phthalate 4,5-dioxygenase oxygenase subunit
LHQIELKDPIDKARWGIFSIHARPYVSATETRFGVRLFTKRNLPNSDDVLMRVTNFVMPNAACVGFVEGYLGNGGCSMLFDVPIDDTDHWRYEFIFHRSGKFDKERLVQQYEAEQIGDRETKRNEANRFYQDRAAMEDDEQYLGMGECFAVHDIFITRSQGAIHNQEDEALGTSDIAIIKSRRMLAQAARDVQDGKDPVGVLRDRADNDFRDMIVYTATVKPDTDLEALCDELAKDGTLYNLEALSPEPLQGHSN